jgi:hypothetical protein
MECEVYAMYSIEVSSFDDDAVPVSACCEGDVLNGGDQMFLNERATSGDGRFKLVYQGDGNLRLYNASWSVMWASNTSPLEYGRAHMQVDGNFVLYDSGGYPYWWTETEYSPGAWLIVQNDGNVVIYSAGGTPLWDTGTCCY